MFPKCIKILNYIGMNLSFCYQTEWVGIISRSPLVHTGFVGHFIKSVNWTTFRSFSGFVSELCKTPSPATSGSPAPAQCQWAASAGSPGESGKGACVSKRPPTAPRWCSRWYSHLEVGSSLLCWWNSPNWKHKTTVSKLSFLRINHAENQEDVSPSQGLHRDLMRVEKSMHMCINVYILHQNVQNIRA